MHLLDSQLFQKVLTESYRTISFLICSRKHPKKQQYLTFLILHSVFSTILISEVLLSCLLKE